MNQVFGPRNLNEVKRTFFKETSGDKMFSKTTSAGPLSSSSPLLGFSINTAKSESSGHLNAVRRTSTSCTKPSYLSINDDNDEFSVDAGLNNIVSSSTVYPVNTNLAFSVKGVTSILAIFVVSIFLCSVLKKKFVENG